ncbi:hypothetical protein [Iodidimonas sp. MBR-22]|uniref:hypothetical protein n=1 Tax=Iodidimonas sp. MBR-22 TaxID=3032320 RepID=UPI002482C689|nr:hypothetical protein [Iodidimonas sp. MBR-22]
MGITAAALGMTYAAWRLYLRYGASDVTQAETIIYGMLLFLLLIIVMAFLVVALLRIIGGLRKRRSVFHPDSGPDDPEDRARKH